MLVVTHILWFLKLDLIRDCSELSIIPVSDGLHPFFRGVIDTDEIRWFKDHDIVLLSSDKIELIDRVYIFGWLVRIFNSKVICVFVPGNSGNITFIWCIFTFLLT